MAALAADCNLLPGAHRLAYLDIDPSHVRVYGSGKQGAQIGRFKGIRTLHPILAVISTPGAAPVIGPVRLRKGRAADVKGAPGFLREAIGAAREAGCSGEIPARMDSAFYACGVVAACRRADVRFSIATGINPSITKAIATIPPDAWADIDYPSALIDPVTGEAVAMAQVAEVPYTAFAADENKAVTARLLVRRVRDLAKPQPETVGHLMQEELFPVYRYHPILTDNPRCLIEAEKEHRRHAIVEPQIADLKASALAHLPSGRFEANHAWLVLAAIAHNLQRAAGVIAGGHFATAETATIRAQLVQVPARIARSARRLTLHLPVGWRWAGSWQRLFDHTHTRPPSPAYH